ncbi:MAG: hypothetical protein ABMA64_19745 [Myxococcota bacterium]
MRGRWVVQAVGVVGVALGVGYGYSWLRDHQAAERARAVCAGLAEQLAPDGLAPTEAQWLRDATGRGEWLLAGCGFTADAADVAAWVEVHGEPGPSQPVGVITSPCVVDNRRLALRSADGWRPRAGLRASQLSMFTEAPQPAADRVRWRAAYVLDEQLCLEAVVRGY